ncbi:Receptor-like serine/threonine-protein kinase ALE2 [Camellia lanceoleosa]|uniref:Receptor-like serine/threonine-protein kinase ALE2 n=1 Tax=Camellia lanceoleosa TaxID=1840588 RepID=A0ACC0F3S2_9ERIC|nr:Receptor-like serine/threonine-protein kinase ALE2 [Camellia lanceoleosa]
MSVFAVSSGTGPLKKIQWLMLKQLLVLSVLCITGAHLRDDLLEGNLVSPTIAPFAAPAIPDLPLPANRPLFYKSHLKHFSPRGAPKLVLSPSQPPYYAPLITATHPPSRSLLPLLRLANIPQTQSTGGTIPSVLPQPPLSPYSSNCCGPDTVLKRGSEGCNCVYPIKLDLLLLNVSSNPNWNTFLQEFALQLGLQVPQINLIDFYMVGLSRLNISMDITPHTGIGFSASEASAINSSLSLHKVHLDPTLVGDYKLLNITWFKPLGPSQAPAIATPSVEAPPLLPSTPTQLVNSNNGKHSNLILIVGIGAGMLIIAIIAVLIICSCSSHQGNKKASAKETAKPRTVDALPAAGSIRHPSSTRFLAYEELKEATNNFEPASILGEGGFGRVFKGVLSDGTAVAIKRLTSGGQQGGKEFLVEVEMLSRLHHRNLVKLVGHYTSHDSSQNLLCYELVPNGSLEAWLHGPLGVNCPLDWDTRMKIALDAARGLAYLHEDSQPCVIHRDFKASNILLENNFHAKVADFGLAKHAPEGRADFLSTRVMGTFGYVAPEYAMTGHLLVKSDVYSYGVVLLELLTGRKPVDMSQPSGQENLVTWARPILRDKDRLEELADPKLGGKYTKEDFVRVCTI